MSTDADLAQQAFNHFFSLATRPIRVRDIGSGYYEILAPASPALEQLMPSVYDPLAPDYDSSSLTSASTAAVTGKVASLAEAEMEDQETNSDNSDPNGAYRTPGHVATRLSKKVNDLRDELVEIGRSLGNAHQELDDVKSEVDALKRMMGE